VVSTTTHKTLRGPRGAMLMCDAEHAKAIDKAVFPGLQGGPHNHTTAAIAVALKEAATDDFRRYAAAVVSNYDIDPRYATISFRIKAVGFMHPEGSFPHFQAHLSIDNADPHNCAMSVVVDNNKTRKQLRLGKGADAHCYF